MRILSLGTDNSVLNKNSPLARRARDYGELIDRYDIIVPAESSEFITLSSKVSARSVAAKNKLAALFRLFTFSKAILKKENYDLITVQDPYFLAALGLFLSRKFHLGFELQIHGWEKFGGLRKAITRYALPRADAVRTVSQRLKKQLINDFGVKEERITVVPIHVEVPSSKFQVPSSKNNDKFIFLTVGRLVPVKNIGMQIEAMAEVVRATHNLPAGQAGAQRITQVELWIAGEGMEGEKLKVKSEKLKIENNVKFFGWQDDLDKFYSQADVFLLTSNYEGWGLVAIEAASYGLPIIMTDVGCAGEVIKNPSINSGQASGIVIPVGDKDKLVEAMIKIIEDKDLRKKLGVNAREAVAKLPTKEETLALYRESWEKALKIKIAL